MAAVTYLFPEQHRTGPTSRPVLRVVATDHVRVRPSRATFLRRRIVVAAVVVALGLGVAGVTAQAGDALGGDSLAASGRDPAVSGSVERAPAPVAVVVRPGESLWSLAARLAPGEDPRPIVDALVKSRQGAPLVPGERIAWAR